jgi:hypothetical protein
MRRIFERIFPALFGHTVSGVGKNATPDYTDDDNDDGDDTDYADYVDYVESLDGSHLNGTLSETGRTTLFSREIISCEEEEETAVIIVIN